MNFTNAMNFAKNKDFIVQRECWIKDDHWTDANTVEVHGVYWNGEFVLMQPPYDKEITYSPTEEDLNANDWELV